jgi:solute carrier family 25 (peroxisomal adenine nucleotide transporter), member 17
LVRTSYISRLTKKLPPGSKLPPLSTAAELLLGAVAGGLAQIFTIPVSVIATRQQVGRSENEESRAASPTADVEKGEKAPVYDDSFLGVVGLKTWLGSYCESRHHIWHVRTCEEYNSIGEDDYWS